jgi:2-succinyl-6-hydroxy-2,4-cyclohexadiene-1-carboxylate synthase
MTPIVFLHGFSGGPSYWDRARAALARPSPSSAIVLPGHGPDPWFPASRDRATFADAVTALAEKWPVGERAIVVGYSMGARLALGLMVSRPALFARAVLVGVHPGLSDPSERAERAALDEARAAAIARDGVDAFIDAWEREPLFASQASLAPAVRAAHRRLRTNHTPAGLSWAMRELGLGHMTALGRAAGASRVPVTLVTGERDAKFTALAASLSAESGFAHRVVRGAGHDVSLEAPLELARIIEEAPSGARLLEGRQ